MIAQNAHKERAICGSEGHRGVGEQADWGLLTGIQSVCAAQDVNGGVDGGAFEQGPTLGTYERLLTGNEKVSYVVLVATADAVI